jgi:hypothetical protein
MDEHLLYNTVLLLHNTVLLLSNTVCINTVRIKEKTSTALR